jgi:hypothetical protein
MKNLLGNLSNYRGSKIGSKHQNHGGIMTLSQGELKDARQSKHIVLPYGGRETRGGYAGQGLAI